VRLHGRVPRPQRIRKATEHLLGEGIRPEHLNDDRLGRILDKLAALGLTKTFVSVAVDEQVLGDEDENQVGKSTAKPTLRWMFQCFMSIQALLSFE
jgi:hypothetical protein